MSADTTWPISWFRSPGLTEPTPLTVDKDGRVFGHAALWGSPHMSFPGRRVTPPRSTQDYRHFHVGATTVIGDDGNETDISVGTLVMGSGHADTSLSATGAAEFYDTTSTVAAVCCAGEDQIGLWVAGAVMGDLDEMSRRRLRACAISGDWRAVPGAGLELVALLAVSTPGFSIPRARVASGAPMALVAAGALPPPAMFGRAVDPAWSPSEVPTGLLAAAGKITTGSLGMRLEISEKGTRFFGPDGKEIITSQPIVDPRGLESAVPSPATLAALIDKRLDERREAAELAAAHAALAAEVDETPQLVASLLAASDDTPGEVASLLADLDETPERVEALLASLDEGDAGPKG